MSVDFVRNRPCRWLPLHFEIEYYQVSLLAGSITQNLRPTVSSGCSSLFETGQLSSNSLVPIE